MPATSSVFVPVGHLTPSKKLQPQLIPGHHFPPELLLRLFQYLPKSSIRSCALVSHRWKTLARELFCKRLRLFIGLQRVLGNQLPYFPQYHEYGNILNYMTFAQEFHIDRGLGALSPKVEQQVHDLAYALQCFDRVQSLTWGSADISRGSDLFVLGDMLSETGRLDRITSLSIYCQEFTSVNALFQIFDYMPNLVSLELRKIYLVDPDEDVRREWKVKLQNLSVLSVDEEIVWALSKVHFPYVRQLSLSFMGFNGAGALFYYSPILTNTTNVGTMRFSLGTSVDLLIPWTQVLIFFAKALLVTSSLSKDQSPTTSS